MTTDDRFAPVETLYHQFVRETPGFSGQLAIHWNGRRVVDLTHGALAGDRMTGLFSASKGIAALVIADLLADGSLVLDEPVATYWPEFAARGKETITVRDLLSHQAGLPVITERVPLPELMVDSHLGAARLAAQRPLWRPGSAFGYHALTIGILMEELVRRVTGRRLQEVYEETIRAPRSAEMYLGLPEAEDHRYVAIADPALTPEQLDEMAAAQPGDALSERVFGQSDAPADGGSGGVITNNPDSRRAGPAAVGGVGSARGLAQLYADTLPGAATPIATPEVFEEMAQQHSWGTDRVLNCPNAFGVVFMLPQPRMPFGGLGAYGHDGAGGALAFADPESGMAFGYVCHPMQHPGGADRRAVELARLARRCALG